MDTTARLGLPLIAPGQAQKELVHNEALALLDIGVQASVIALGIDEPPADAAVGDCWIVGPAPTGAWSGQARAIACRTAGGWRFLPAREGLSAWHVGERRVLRHTAGAWGGGAAVAAANGGAVVDVEARATLAAILDRLRAHGLIAA